MIFGKKIFAHMMFNKSPRIPGRHSGCLPGTPAPALGFNQVFTAPPANQALVRLPLPTKPRARSQNMVFIVS